MEREDAERAAAELAPLSLEERVRRVRRDPRHHTWVLCQLFLERVEHALTEEPAEAIHWAEMAVAASEQLDGSSYHPDWVSDLLARCWGSLGNAKRVLGELRSADTDLRRAEEILRGGSTGRPDVLIQILSWKASLRCDQGAHEETLAILERAIACARDIRAAETEGRLLVQQAWALEATGELREAIPLLGRAIQLLDPSGRSAFVASFNLACFLIHTHRFDEASERLSALAPRLAEAPTLDRIRFRWAEGAVAAGLGEAEAAEAALIEARDSFVERELGLDAGLVSLDLALHYLDQGRWDAIREVAAEVVPLFHGQNLHRETVAALLLFERAVHREELTADLLRELTATLRRRVAADF